MQRLLVGFASCEQCSELRQPMPALQLVAGLTALVALLGELTRLKQVPP